MGFIGSLFGGDSGNSGDAGINFQGGNYSNQITGNQYTQDNFINALQAQNGIQNQSNAYNSLGGVGQQLQGVANGTGPNPAAAMLQQATNQNNATTSAQIASQRGVNPGLAARLGAEQGAQNQQNSAAQAATMQSQQQLGALGQMGNIYAQQGNIAQQQVGNQYNAIQNQGANLASLQNAATGANSQVANSVVGQQGQVAGGLMQAAGPALSMGMAALAKGGQVQRYSDGTPDAPISLTSPPPQLQVAPDIQAMSGPQSSFGKFAQAYSNNGGSNSSSPSGPNSSQPLAAGTAAMGKGLTSGLSSLIGGGGGGAGAAGGASSALPIAALAAAKGGQIQKKKEVPALVSPGEVYLPPEQVKEVAKGKKDPIHAGEKIPGKAKFKGNNYANDTVPKTLEEGGIVLPKSVMEAKHPHWEAHKFVSAILAKQGLKKK